VNVKAEMLEHDSLFDWYKSLIQLKKTNQAFAHGENVMLDTENTKVLSWMRQVEGGPQVVVAANFTAEPQTVNLATGVKPGHVKTLLKSPGGVDPTSLDHIELAPFGVYIGQLN
jgi:alpha-glucosidase